MRGKGEGAILRVPADKTKPLKFWEARLELPSHDGTRRRKVIRRKNKTELVAELTRMRGDLEHRGDLPTSTQSTEQWFAYWLETVVAKEVRPNTLDQYRRTIRNHVIPAIGKVKIDKLSPTHMRRVHETIIEKGLSPTTAALAHRTMSASFKIAVREGRIGRNPAELVNAPRKAKPKLEALDLPEAVRMIEHSLTYPMGARWATFLLTGARRGEILGLEWDRVTDQLDLSWQLIRIKLTDTDGVPDVPADYEYRHLTGGLYLTRPKSDKGWRIIPLVDPLRAILERHRETSPPNPYGLVFARPNGRPYAPDVESVAWRHALTAAGIDKDVRLHDARHTTVDLLYEAGVPEDIIGEIIGHSVRTTTRGYKTPQNRARLLAAMEQFSTQFTLPTTRTPEIGA
ncbi:site-specific integrase [uncultured Microbacterium sp.]|uniref:site-specific integrase n=1 Tax=uncultured Microbacterium sp. TaxID=191216 RepID=UPI0026046952|nr:site-specific integrase [uncultured Microbacterium sp.]